MSSVYGFTFDTSVVKTQISEWESRMFAVGLQDIVDKLQKQLDEWAARKQ